MAELFLAMFFAIHSDPVGFVLDLFLSYDPLFMYPRRLIYIYKMCFKNTTPSGGSVRFNENFRLWQKTDSVSSPAFPALLPS